jgi:rod shape-determining protein MreC
VQILLDRDCSVGALIARSSATGVVSGQVGIGDQGTSDLVMKYVGALADVVVGDEVVTSGLDGIYPKGLIVGHVRSVVGRSGLFKEVLVEPSAMFDRIEEVLIVERSDDDRSLTAAVR